MATGDLFLLKNLQDLLFESAITNKNTVTKQLGRMIEIHMLEIAQGLRDYLITSGLSVEAILKSNPSELSSILGIELYVARLIFNAAKKAAGRPAFDKRILKMLTE